MGEFQGWLIKIKGIIFPTSYIFKDSYISTPNQVMDSDPYRDANGLLHRNVLPHTATKIEFNLKPMHLREMQVARAFFVPREKLQVEYWNDEEQAYRTGEFYVPDISFEYYLVDKKMNDIFYKETKIVLIEY